MNILGLQKTTLLDYPGCVAATIFLGGCNMRCPFCHNMNLVIADSTTVKAYTVDDIISFLEKRKGVLDGVCITGGEPTLYSDLPELIRQIKALSYKVKLDTNGTNPDMLNSLIADKLIDYVAMDIKSSLKEYPTVCGVDDIDIERINRSIHILRSSDIDHEFRTTLISEYHTQAVIQDIGVLLKGAKKYYLQSFKDSEYVPNHKLTALSYDKLSEYKIILSDYIEHVEIRGVDPVS